MTSTIQRYQPPANGSRPAAVSQATSIEQSRAIADVQAAVTVAQNCPRDMAEAEREMEYVCSRLDVAEQAFYQVNNRGTGPSVHLMRELARIWGNVDYGVKELARSDDKGESEVLATCWDMQKNTRSSRTFIVPHARMKSGSRQALTDLTDIYLNNQNIGARAVRECIQTILPRWFTQKAQDICHNTIEHGEGEPLIDRIATMVDWFGSKIGVTQAQMESRIGRKRGQWTAEDVAQMKIAGKSIVAGEIGRDEVFPPIAADTVGEIACTADADSAPAAGSKLSGKVKSAGGESGPGPGGGNDATQQAKPSGPPDQDSPAAEPPGAPTESTPGQTERVAKALDNARKMPAKSRAVYQENLAALFAEVRCDSNEDQLVIAADITEHGEVATYLDVSELTDDELKTTVNTLTTWKSKGELDDKVRDILNTADLKAAQQDDPQQTLDSTD